MKTNIDVNRSYEGYGDSFDGNEPTKKKKSHALRNAIIIIAAILVLLAAGAAAVVILAYQTPNSDKFGAEPDSVLIENIVVSAVKGEPADISNEDLNSFIAYLIDNEEKSPEKPQKLKDAAIYAHSDRPCELYAMADIGGHTYEISAEFEIDDEIKNHEIKLSVTSAKLGGLPLPPDLMMNYAFSDSSLADSLEYIRRDGSDIYISSDYAFEIFSQKIEIDVESIKPLEDGIRLKTTSVADIILGSLDSWLSSLLK